ncbi:unnamed protein product [Paramecium sonneborni]|uniref:Uncharacterized protein n=1 Tax=Paramecium sonneborni TaxID=65129 RepID=A0A8S1M0I8_9CILI|nr:unnamed protein product [Paramecium sonneborni]
MFQSFNKSFMIFMASSSPLAASSTYFQNNAFYTNGSFNSVYKHQIIHIQLEYKKRPFSQAWILSMNFTQWTHQLRMINQKFRIFRTDFQQNKQSCSSSWIRTFNFMFFSLFIKQYISFFTFQQTRQFFTKFFSNSFIIEILAKRECLNIKLNILEISNQKLI